MTIVEPYVTTKARIEARGRFAIFRAETQDLVCASKKHPPGWGYGGRSFWIWHCRMNGRWYLGTWDPKYFLIPTVSDPVDVSIALLECDNERMTEVMERFGLTAVSDEDFSNLSRTSW